ncbi:MAG: hypothetical protein ABSE73_32380, partial [Planctomycetota bacterium]
GATGYVLGLVSLSAFNSGWYPVGPTYSCYEVIWRFNGALHFAWQGAVAMAVLHLGACLGAIMGAAPGASSLGQSASHGN